MLNVSGFQSYQGALPDENARVVVASAGDPLDAHTTQKIARQVLADVLKNCVGVFSVVSRSWIGR